MDQELQSPKFTMSRPVFKSAQSLRGFGVHKTEPARVSRSADIERIVSACGNQPAELETSRGLVVGLEFAPKQRATASAIAFRVREDSLVPTLDTGIVSFSVSDAKYSFRADISRGNDGHLYASFPSRLF
jgi:hypothetical protein